jgi:hypothetical protein
MPKKEEGSLDTYAPLECTEAGETFLGVVKMFSWDWKRPMISLADS